jgi:hypothetical protein
VLAAFYNNSQVYKQVIMLFMHHVLAANCAAAQQRTAQGQRLTATENQQNLVLGLLVFPLLLAQGASKKQQQGPHKKSRQKTTDRMFVYAGCGLWAMRVGCGMAPHFGTSSWLCGLPLRASSLRCKYECAWLAAGNKYNNNNKRGGGQIQPGTAVLITAHYNPLCPLCAHYVPIVPIIDR